LVLVIYISNMNECLDSHQLLNDLSYFHFFTHINGKNGGWVATSYHCICHGVTSCM